MSFHRRTSRPLGLMASLALVSSVAACNLTGAPSSTPVVPAASGEPVTSATATPAATTPSPSPSSSATTAPVATPTPSPGGGGSGGGGSSNNPGGPVATFDAEGDQLKVRVSQTGGSSAFIDTFIVQVNAAQLNTALGGGSGYRVLTPPTTFRVAGGKVNLGDTYKFDLSAPTPATLNSLSFDWPGSMSADATKGTQAEARLVVADLGNGGFGNARVMTTAADNWRSAASVYFVTQYNAQPVFNTDAGKAVLARSQTSELLFRMPGYFSSHNFSVKVIAVPRAVLSATAVRTLTATFDANLIADN